MARWAVRSGAVLPWLGCGCGDLHFVRASRLGPETARNPPPQLTTPILVPSSLPATACLRGPQSRSLASTTSAGANGSTVAPGQTITVTITRNPNRLLRKRLPFQTHECVEIGFRISRALSQEHQVDPSVGTVQFSFVVPPDGTGGNQICDRAAVSGLLPRPRRAPSFATSSWAQRAPRFPSPLMLPVAALGLMGGGGLWVARRRRQRITT